MVNKQLTLQGCFWGVENYFNKHFKQGLLSSEVGYCGGEAADPNYRQVCSQKPMKTSV